MSAVIEKAVINDKYNKSISLYHLYNPQISCVFSIRETTQCGAKLWWKLKCEEQIWIC